jgi:hypothetical protein
LHDLLSIFNAVIVGDRFTTSTTNLIDNNVSSFLRRTLSLVKYQKSKENVRNHWNCMYFNQSINNGVAIRRLAKTLDRTYRWCFRRDH